MQHILENQGGLKNIVQQDRMFYRVKFVYVNLQICKRMDKPSVRKKNKKLLYKITKLEKSKNLWSRHNQVGQIIIPMLCIACEAWLAHRDHVFVAILVVPLVTHWLPIYNS